VQKVYSVVSKYKKNGIDPIDLTSVVISESLKNEFDPLFVAAVIKVESGFNPKAVSPVGARGLMQIMPETKLFIEKLNDFTPERGKSIFDSRYNIKLGIRYLKYLREKFKGNMSLALMAYNWGPFHVESTISGKRSGVPHSVLKYAVLILEDHSRWHTQISQEVLFQG
jgi:soluble lytic murein transglycosylase